MKKLKELTGTMKIRATLNSEFVLENRDSIVADIAGQVQAQGGETLIENNCLYAKGSNQYWRLPTLPRVREGVAVFRSKDFLFQWQDDTGERESVADKPKAGDMTEYGFTSLNFRGDVTQWELLL